jgi:hypothetical protein
MRVSDPINREPKPVGISDERGDVLKHDPGLRKVWDVTDTISERTLNVVPGLIIHDAELWHARPPTPGTGENCLCDAGAGATLQALVTQERGVCPNTIAAK